MTLILDCRRILAHITSYDALDHVELDLFKILMIYSGSNQTVNILDKLSGELGTPSCDYDDVL